MVLFLGITRLNFIPVVLGDDPLSFSSRHGFSIFTIIDACSRISAKPKKETGRMECDIIHWRFSPRNETVFAMLFTYKTNHLCTLLFLSTAHQENVPKPLFIRLVIPNISVCLSSFNLHSNIHSAVLNLFLPRYDNIQ